MDRDVARIWIELGAVDASALLVVSLAIVRGLWIGMIREAFSLAALAAACLAIRFGTLPFADWLALNAPIDLAPLAARIAAGALLGFGALVLVGRVGAALRRGIRAVGLGLLDRLAGGGLGAAEGVLVVALAMLLVGAVLGTDHPALRDSRTLATLDAVRDGLRETPPDVAAPYEAE
ncbi:MAG: CvpA family protein [Planctomycetota bacterium]|jgi:membrane protein required for colicin V production|nr:hypothetical protein [Deltaproteobacteria bacterium]MDP6540794.1 CvpA family protein [Planctomycetota bacterium]